MGHSERKGRQRGHEVLSLKRPKPEASPRTARAEEKMARERQRYRGGRHV